MARLLALKPKNGNAIDTFFCTFIVFVLIGFQYKMQLNAAYNLCLSIGIPHWITII